MKLIEEWRQAWRYWSVRVSAAGATLFAALIAFPDQAQAIWQQLPPAVQTLVPHSEKVALALMVATIAARVIRQGQH